MVHLISLHCKTYWLRGKGQPQCIEAVKQGEDKSGTGKRSDMRADAAGQRPVTA